MTAKKVWGSGCRGWESGNQANANAGVCKREVECSISRSLQPLVTGGPGSCCSQAVCAGVGVGRLFRVKAAPTDVVRGSRSHRCKRRTEERKMGFWRTDTIEKEIRESTMQVQ